jgi:CrcB protein
MKTILLIGTGGFIGTIFRYLLSQFIQSKVLSTFPLGTLGVNVLGCFVIGIVFALSERTNMHPEWRLFLATGICGVLPHSLLSQMKLLDYYGMDNFGMLQFISLAVLFLVCLRHLLVFHFLNSSDSGK